MQVTNQIKNMDTLTREELRTKRKKEKERSKETRRPKKIRIRLIPIWLRLIIILVLVIVSAFAGVYIGYSVIGNGNPADAFHLDTWQHIRDLVNKK